MNNITRGSLIPHSVIMTGRQMVLEEYLDMLEAETSPLKPLTYTQDGARIDIIYLSMKNRQKIEADFSDVLPIPCLEPTDPAWCSPGFADPDHTKVSLGGFFMNAYPSSARPQKSSAIDPFRMAAAFLIIAIHTAPLSSLSETADFLFSYCLGRIAVPFFLMTTGYFVLAPLIYSPNPSACGSAKMPASSPRRLSYWTKTSLLYLAATLLYLPVNIYSGKLPALKDLFQVLIFDGTFYHLWYLPAALLGMLLLFLLAKICSFRVLFGISMVLYLIGLLGDSWYGLIEPLTPVRAVYDGIFQISSYTRNGVFYAPVFLLMGARLSRTRIHQRYDAAMVYLTAALISLALMLGEGYFTFTKNWQRHNSMYLFLIPCMFFLFQLLLCLPGKSSPSLRTVTLLIYLLHPLVIILIRGFAKVTRLSAYLVENSLIHYLAVCAGSFAAALCLTLAAHALQRFHRHS